MSVSLQKNFDLASSSQAVRHRVLRNTYWLLALSLIPTVLGAVAGIQLGVPVPTGIMGFILFLAIAFGFMWAIEKNKNSGLGVGLLLGFTFFMGLMLTPLLTRTLGFSNGGQLIAMAFGGTATIMAVMATIATTTKRDFSFLGQWLFAGVIVLILGWIAAMAFNLPGFAVALSVMAVAIFSGFLLYDVQRIVNGGETNYVSATLSIYLDLYNIFSNLLALLGLGGERE
jgi:FtsH-binding integral membrane protein